MTTFILLGDVCLSYSPASDTWTSLAKPQNTYYNSSAVGWQGKILLVDSKNAEEYDPDTDSWTAKDELLPSDAAVESVYVNTFFM